MECRFHIDRYHQDSQSAPSANFVQLVANLRQKCNDCREIDVAWTWRLLATPALPHKRQTTNETTRPTLICSFLILPSFILDSMTLNNTHSGIFPSARQFVSSVSSRTILAKHNQCFRQSRLLTGCLETSKIFTRCYCTDWGDSIRINVVYQHRSIALRHAVKVQIRAGISENIKPLGNLS